jgi:hypothetical protein
MAQFGSRVDCKQPRCQVSARMILLNAWVKPNNCNRGWFYQVFHSGRYHFCVQTTATGLHTGTLREHCETNCSMRRSFGKSELPAVNHRIMMLRFLKRKQYQLNPLSSLKRNTAIAIFHYVFTEPSRMFVQKNVRLVYKPVRPITGELDRSSIIYTWRFRISMIRFKIGRLQVLSIYLYYTDLSPHGILINNGLLHWKLNATVILCIKIK